jgi:hypothetical protein
LSLAENVVRGRFTAGIRSGVAPRSVKGDWFLARMFLYSELRPGRALPADGFRPSAKLGPDRNFTGNPATNPAKPKNSTLHLAPFLFHDALLSECGDQHRKVSQRRGL